MRLAIASGKGGTGKTTVAVNLATVLAQNMDGPVRLLDCDVEEPNAHIFLRPKIERREAVSIPVPEVDEELCDACGECSRFCEFKAIVSFKTKPLVFAELCHGCGGCAKVCPRRAIREVPREIGAIEFGTSGAIEFVQGRLNVGEPMSPPVIRAVLKHTRNDGATIVDCPPGTSCPVIVAVRDCDYGLLVTEPTPFGLHDLKLAVSTFRQLGIPFGVAINRVGAGDDRVADYCAAEGLPVPLRLPDDRRIAEAYSRGRMAVDAVPEVADAFRGLWPAIERSLTSVQSDE